MDFEKQNRLKEAGWNSDLVVLCSPQKEQETIKLYSDLMGVFLTPVLS